MRVSIELFLLDNWLMNAATLLLASAISGLRVKKRLSAFLCFVGALYALLAFWKLPFLLFLPFRIFMGALLASGLGRTSFHDYMRACLCVFLSAMLLGGALYALSIMDAAESGAYGYVNGVLIGAAVRTRILLLFIPLAAIIPRCFRGFRNAAKMDRACVRLCITLDGKKHSLKALIDSGNLLVEPLSGLPVALLNDAINIEGHLPVPYASIDGEGELLVKHASHAFIETEKGAYAIDLMVANAPSPILGAQAIIGSLALPPVAK